MKHLREGSGASKKKPRPLGPGFWNKSLAIPYFRMANCHTIIGAKRFHFRVRDGIGWFTLAMVTKQTGVIDRRQGATAQGERRYYSLSAWSLDVALYPVFLGVSLTASASSTLSRQVRLVGCFLSPWALLPAVAEICNSLRSLAFKASAGSGLPVSSGLFSPFACEPFAPSFLSSN